MIDEVDSPVFHNKVPVAVVDSTDVPSQLSVTVTTGIAGPLPGAAVPEPASLVQPFTVAVTVYVPALDTVMDGVDSPVFHKRVPVALVESVEVPLQLFTTVTTGVTGPSATVNMPFS